MCNGRAGRVQTLDVVLSYLYTCSHGILVDPRHAAPGGRVSGPRGPCSFLPAGGRGVSQCPAVPSRGGLRCCCDSARARTMRAARACRRVRDRPVVGCCAEAGCRAFAPLTRRIPSRLDSSVRRTKARLDRAAGCDDTTGGRRRVCKEGSRRTGVNRLVDKGISGSPSGTSIGSCRGTRERRTAHLPEAASIHWGD